MLVLGLAHSRCSIMAATVSIEWPRAGRIPEWEEKEALSFCPLMAGPKDSLPEKGLWTSCPPPPTSQPCEALSPGVLESRISEADAVLYTHTHPPQPYTDHVTDAKTEAQERGHTCQKITYL